MLDSTMKIGGKTPSNKTWDLVINNKVIPTGWLVQLHRVFLLTTAMTSQSSQAVFAQDFTSVFLNASIKD